MSSPSLQVVRRLFSVLEAGDDPDALDDIYRPDAVQVEHPSRIAPGGLTRNLAQMKEAMARGRGVVRSQRYEILRLFEAGVTVAAEVRWSAELVGAPPRPIAASLAVFFVLSEGRIASQRNYDCFDPEPGPPSRTS